MAYFILFLFSTYEIPHCTLHIAHSTITYICKMNYLGKPSLLLTCKMATAMIKEVMSSFSLCHKIILHSASVRGLIYFIEPEVWNFRKRRGPFIFIFSYVVLWLVALLPSSTFILLFFPMLCYDWLLCYQAPPSCFSIQMIGTFLISLTVYYSIIGHSFCLRHASLVIRVIIVYRKRTFWTLKGLP